MENATKALIIAGAVLVSIILISIGVSLIRSSDGAKEQATQAGSEIESAAATKVTEIKTQLNPTPTNPTNP